MYRRARAILGSDEEAQDAMQEVFVRLIARDGELGGAPLLAWVYRVTTNLCLNRLRQRASHPLAVDPEAVSRIAAGEIVAEDRRAVMQILGRMDPLTQQIAVHHYVDGMKMEEVAEVVGKSRKTVGKKLAAFRDQARRLLEVER